MTALRVPTVSALACAKSGTPWLNPKTRRILNQPLPGEWIVELGDDGETPTGWLTIDNPNISAWDQVVTEVFPAGHAYLMKEYPDSQASREWIEAVQARKDWEVFGKFAEMIKAGRRDEVNELVIEQIMEQAEKFKIDWAAIVFPPETEPEVEVAVEPEVVEPSVEVPD